jgi:hypothetical protein
MPSAVYKLPNAIADETSFLLSNAKLAQIKDFIQ